MQQIKVELGQSILDAPSFLQFLQLSAAKLTLDDAHSHAYLVLCLHRTTACAGSDL